jgi:hypothetical protein
MEQPLDDVNEIYNQKLGEALNFFASNLPLYFSSSRLTLLLTLLVIPPDLSFPMSSFWEDLIPLPSRLQMMDRDALNFFPAAWLSGDWKIFQSFLDSDHPLALDGRRYATAASACLKIIFKHYQVPLSCFQRISRHSLTPRLGVNMKHLSPPARRKSPGVEEFPRNLLFCSPASGNTRNLCIPRRPSMRSVKPSSIPAGKICILRQPSQLRSL